jgi:hypothetical protein
MATYRFALAGHPDLSRQADQPRQHPNQQAPGIDPAASWRFTAEYTAAANCCQPLPDLCNIFPFERFILALNNMTTIISHPLCGHPG